MLLLAAFLALFLPQTDTAAKPKEEPKPTASISGKVTNSLDQSPVRKAEVRLFSSERRMVPRSDAPTTTTDDAGAYRFDGIEPGRYAVVVRKTGFVDVRGGRTGRGLQVTVADGQKLSGTDIQLVPTAAIAGRVMDEDGEPIEGAVVTAIRRGRAAAQRGFPQDSERTDDRGEFRLSGLHPGVRYYLAVAYTDRTPPATGELRAYQRVYYPAAESLEAATALSLRPGEERSLDFQLIPTRAFRVRGTVSGLDPEQHRTGLLIVTAADEPVWMAMGRGMPNSIDPQKPTFETAPLVPGRYTLRVMALAKDGEPRLSRAEMGQTEVTVGEGDVSGVGIAIGGGAEISGRVSGLPSGQDPDGIFVQLRTAREADGVTFAFGPMGMNRAAVKKDGAFTIENVPDGEYFVEVSFIRPEWRDWYARSIRYGSRDALAEPIRIASGKAEALDVTIASDSARLVGIARDSSGKPYAGAIVTVVPPSRYRDRASFYQSATTDQNGRFDIRGLRPAEYTLLAWDNEEAREAVRDKEFLEQHASAGKTVTLAAAAQQGVELQVVPMPESDE